MHQNDINARIEAIRALLLTWDQASDAEQRQRQEQINTHQRIISDAYGATRGWLKAAAHFPIRALAPVSEIGEEWERQFTDHRSYWTIDDRPVAIVAHLYGCDEGRRAAACAWATRHGLQATFPDDIVSWWYPGRTILIEITRASKLAA